MKSATTITQPPISISTSDITEVGDLTSFLQRTDAVHNQTTTKTKYRGLLNKLEQFLDDDGCDEETFQAGISHLTSAVGVMNSMKRTRNSNDQELIPAKKIAPNTNSHCQPRFHSTKRKRISNEFSLAKPTTLHLDECKTNLTQLSVNVCGICFREDIQTEDSTNTAVDLD